MTPYICLTGKTVAIGSGMILSCPKCAARFGVDPGKLAPAGRTVGCSKCGHRWRVTAQGAPVGDAPAAPVPVPGLSAREILARQSADAQTAGDSPAPAPILTATPDLAPTTQTESIPAEPDATAKSAAAAAMPVQSALSPRQRQKLQAARKGRSRTRLIILVLLVLIAIMLLFAAMQRAPQIENALRPAPADGSGAVPAPEPLTPPETPPAVTVDPVPPAPAAGN